VKGCDTFTVPEGLQAAGRIYPRRRCPVEEPVSTSGCMIITDAQPVADRGLGPPYLRRVRLACGNTPAWCPFLSWACAATQVKRFTYFTRLPLHFVARRSDTTVKLCENTGIKLTRSARLFYHPKLPKLLRCQDFRLAPLL